MNEDEQYERRERQINFIMEQQAQFTIDMQRMKESDDELRRILAEYMTQSNEYMAQSNERMTRIERNAGQQQQKAEQQQELLARTQSLLYSSLENQKQIKIDQEQMKATMKTIASHVDRIGEAMVYLLDRDSRKNGDGI
ncbi:MAG: hypothetical protein MSG64_02415 [Pyrinomonadaceae bacterium MAG19_C2-C3]|nr:hypothetical protein [Pyrinomonadaceae bacterium MAG19_C2-C3]